MPLYHRTLEILENTPTKDFRIEEVGQDIDAIKGTVSNHSLRKKVFLSALEEAERPVINELHVQCRKRLNPSRMLGELKRDPYLKGATFSLGNKLTYQSNFHVDCFTGALGEVTLTGRVPSKNYRAYLEAKLWLAPGVSRVINLTSPATLAEPEPDPASVLHKLIMTDPTLDPQISDDISATTQHKTLHLQGQVPTAAVLEGLEHDAWAIPMVYAVRNEVCVIH